jgi:hypothetical protein
VSRTVLTTATAGAQCSAGTAASGDWAWGRRVLMAGCLLLSDTEWVIPWAAVGWVRSSMPSTNNWGARSR